MVPTKDEPLWSDIALHMVLNTISHPIEYAKVLIQIGHEPIAPRPSTTLFNKPILALPNVFQYVKYIKDVDHFSGCYRGLVPKLCSNTISAIVINKTSKYIDKRHTRKYRENEEENAEEEGESWSKFIFEMIRNLLSKTVAVIVSHPFDVITLRMMAQFVGRETKYSDVLSSFVRIYREDGIMGYYAGLVPRLIAHASVIILASTSTYLINKYVISDRDLKVYTATTMQFLASTVTYPYWVVSHCMAVNNCGLAAGMPPNMPIYDNWKDCWSHLSSMNQLKRGSSLLWRYYTGPSININGRLVPVSKNDFYPQGKIL